MEMVVIERRIVCNFVDFFFFLLSEGKVEGGFRFLKGILCDL